MIKKLLTILVIALCFNSIAFATVTNQTDRVSYTCDNSTVEFSYTFPTTATSDLVVKTKVIATGVEDTLTLTTDYTATASESGGAVTTVATYDSTYEIHIQRVTPKTQTLDLTVGGAVNVERLEDAYDKAIKLATEAYQNSLRALRVPTTESDPNAIGSAIDRASKYLYFDADGDIGLASATDSTRTIADIPATDGSLIVGDGTNWQAQAKGGYDNRDYANIAEAQSAIGTSPCTFNIYDEEALTASTTFDPNWSVVIHRGGSIAKASTYTLTFEGPFEAGIYTVFTGFDSNDITFDNARVGTGYPQWFGAVADGVTDDVDAFNAAVTALRHVYVPAGNYAIDANAVGNYLSAAGIVIPSDTWLEMSPDTILTGIPNGLGATTGTGSSIITIGDITVGVTIKNVKVTGGTLQCDRRTHDYGAAGTHEFPAGIHILDANNVYIEDVNIVDSTGFGIHCTGINSGGNYTPCENLTFNRCVFRRNRSLGLALGACINVTVTDCEFYDTGLDDGIAAGVAPMIALTIESGTYTKHVIIKGCRFENNLFGSAWPFKANYVDIIGNYMDTNIGVGGSSNINIVGNVLKDASITSTSGPWNNLTEGTMIATERKYEIVSQSTLDFTTVGSADNNVGTIFTCTVAALLGAGDELTSIRENVNISGNTITNGGISVADAAVTNFLISNNNIDGAYYDSEPNIIGIVAATDKITISGNDISRCTSAIRLNDGNDVAVVGNVIRSCTGANIYAYNLSGNILVKGNSIYNMNPTSLVSAVVGDADYQLIAEGNFFDLGNDPNIKHAISSGGDGSIYSGNVVRGGLFDNAVLICAENCDVVNNTLIDVNSPRGIYLYGDTGSVVGNYLSVINPGGTTWGIKADSTTAMDIFDNVIIADSNLTDAIITSGSTGSRISGNTIYAGGITPHAGDSIGVNINDTNLELGDASDTTITRASAGVIAVEGTNVAMTGTSAATLALSDGVSGTLVMDDGATERITLVFTNGILTSRTVAATVGSLIDWTD